VASSLDHGPKKQGLETSLISYNTQWLLHLITDLKSKDWKLL